LVTLHQVAAIDIAPNGKAVARLTPEKADYRKQKAATRTCQIALNPDRH
jgi:antitoxin (DNA-binding transcriptional repressor) of toxin-antitoxin stability system